MAERHHLTPRQLTAIGRKTARGQTGSVAGSGSDKSNEETRKAHVIQSLVSVCVYVCVCNIHTLPLGTFELSPGGAKETGHANVRGKKIPSRKTK